MTCTSKIFQRGSNFTIPTHEFYREIPMYIRVVATGKWYRKFGLIDCKYDPRRLPL